MVSYAYASLLVGADHQSRLDRQHLGHQGSSDVYLNRSICFQRRLRELNSAFPLVVAHNYRDDDLDSHFDRTVRINVSAAKLQSLESVHLLKLQIWTLIEFERLILVDSDLYLRTLPDVLFGMPMSHPIAAVPGCGDAFNSGLIMLKPNLAVYNEMQMVIASGASKRFHHACTGEFMGDQRFLNGFFGNNYTRLSKMWNSVHKYDFVEPTPAHEIENIHFTGHAKPDWHLCRHGTYTAFHSASEYQELREYAAKLYPGAQKNHQKYIVQSYETALAQMRNESQGRWGSL